MDNERCVCCLKVAVKVEENSGVDVLLMRPAKLVVARSLLGARTCRIRADCDSINDTLAIAVGVWNSFRGVVGRPAAVP